MLNLLIVDDEVLEVEVIKSSVNAEKLDIGNIFIAYDMLSAQEIFVEHNIHLMLTDIEMPHGSGLDLLEWVKENHPQTKCIFLTCHADFNYAKRAINLGSIDYLLKPPQNDELERSLIQAIGRINQESQTEEEKNFSRLWLKHQPILLEQFWNDILNHKIASTQGAIGQAALSLNFPGIEENLIMPILISPYTYLHFQVEPMSPRDQKLTNYGLRNIADELIVKESGMGITIELNEGPLLVVLYCENNESENIDIIRYDCNQFVYACKEYLEVELICYIGAPIVARELVDMKERLLYADKNNVMRKSHVLLLSEVRSIGEYIIIPDVDSWIDMLNQGLRDEMLGQIKDYILLEISKMPLNADSIFRFRQDVLQMIYFYLRQKEINAHDLFNDNVSVAIFDNVNSVENLIYWVDYVVTKATDFVQAIEKSANLVERTKNFIRQNIEKDFSRQDVADNVHFNHDYLARIFKKETGIKLSDYIIQERLSLAKRMLETTDMSITMVAEKVGYTNFSYFSTLFKNLYGISPVKYKRKYQDASPGTKS